MSQSIAIASNSAVNRDRASAHGTRTCCTPCSAHRTRSTSARSSVRYCIVDRRGSSVRSSRLLSPENRLTFENRLTPVQGRGRVVG